MDSLLHTLPAAELYRLGEMVRHFHFAAGERIAIPDLDTNALIVLQGCVRLFKEDASGRRVVLGERFRGDVIVDEAGDLDAEATEVTAVWALPWSELLELISHHPPSAAAVLATLLRDLSEERLLLREYAFYSPLARVAHTLAHWADGRSLVMRDLDELAGLAGVDRTALARALHHLQRQRLIRLASRREILVLDAEQLAAYREEA